MEPEVPPEALTYERVGLPTGRRCDDDWCVAENTSSNAFSPPAALVVQRLAYDSADGSERAGWLVDLSNRLGELGRWEEALAAIEEAVLIDRRLAEDRPDEFLRDLAA